MYRGASWSKQWSEASSAAAEDHSAAARGSNPTNCEYMLWMSVDNTDIYFNTELFRA
jgi:hypothetical protein